MTEMEVHSTKILQIGCEKRRETVHRPISHHLNAASKTALKSYKANPD